MSTFDPNLENNSSSADITIGPAADLQVSQADSPDPLVAGQRLTYSLRVDNLGPEIAEGVALIDTLPAGVVFDAATPSQGSCSEEAGVVTCNLGNIANTGFANVVIEVIPGLPGSSLSNHASVAALSPADSDPANNDSIEYSYVIANCRPILYASKHIGKDDPSTLFTIDPITAEASMIGDIGFERVGALDIDPHSGRLYGTGERTDGSDTPVLLSIDMVTGKGSEIGPMEILKPIGDISFRNSDSVLYTFGSYADVHTVNTISGEVTLLGTALTVPESGNSLTFSPADQLYNAGVKLYTVNQATGLASHLSDLTFSLAAEEYQRLPGMDFDPSTSRYYVIVKDGFPPDYKTYLGTLEVGSGMVTIIGQTQNGLDGLAVQCLVIEDGIFADSFEDPDE